LPDFLRQYAALKKRIIIQYGKMKVEIQDPEELGAVLRQIGWNPPGSADPSSSSEADRAGEDLYVLLKMVAEKAPEPVSAKELAAAMGLKKSTGMWAAIERWSQAAQQLGYDLDDLVTRKRKKDRRVWEAGPKIEAAIRKIERG
jgi:hypothetical protein